MFTLLFLMVSAPACLSTSAVPVTEVCRPGRLRDMALPTLDRSSARLGPASGVRFLRNDGYYTPWVSASLLWTNQQGVFLRHSADRARGRDRFEGIEWGSIRRAEVRNFEGGQTVLATVTAGAIAAVFVAAAVADIEDTKNCVEGSGPCDGGSRVAAVGEIAYVAGSAAASASDDADLGPDAPKAHYFSDPRAPHPSAEGARPLFTGSARRRAVIKGLVAAETTGTSDSKGEVHLQPGAFAGARFGNFIEAGAAVRSVATGGDAPPQTVVAGRAGLHGELGAERRFAVPLSVDVGAGRNISDYVRINWGMRLRIYDELTLGIHPASPTFIKREKGPGRSGWSVASGAELS